MRRTALIRRILVLAAIGGVIIERGSAQVAEDPPPFDGVEYLEGVEDDEGYTYFPTRTETHLLSNGTAPANYPRSRSPFQRNMAAPDAPSLTASGLWRYNDPEQNFYQRNDAFFAPVDSVLGVMAPREVISIEAEGMPYTDATIDVGLPLTRNFDPERAHVKLGPVYFDLLSVGARVLYSDFNSEDIELKYDDGWMSSLELAGRVYARLTDSLYFSMAGKVYYLPGTNRWGLDLGMSSRSFGRLNWSRQLGSWYVHAFNEFRVMHRANDILDPIKVNEIDRSGRYRFGRPDNYRTNGYFDDRSLVYRNLLGVRASTLLNPVWRMSLGYDRTDFWKTSDFDNHSHRDRFDALFSYEGSRWLFSPYFSYTAISHDFWDSVRNRFWVGGYGRLAENVRAFLRVGYLLNSGDNKPRQRDSLLYEGGLTHELSENTRHSLFGGLTFNDDRFGDDGLFSYLRYTLSHHFGSRVLGRGFVSLADRQDDFDETRWTVGASGHIWIADYTSLVFLSRYIQSDFAGRGVRADRWVHRATLNQRLASRLYGSVSYQYEEYSEIANSFTEHLVSFALTRYF